MIGSKEKFFLSDSHYRTSLTKIPKGLIKNVWMVENNADAQEGIAINQTA